MAVPRQIKHRKSNSQKKIFVKINEPKIRHKKKILSHKYGFDEIIGNSLAMQEIFGLIKIGGWHNFRAALDPDLFNLWKPLIPHGVESTWRQ
jgi:hypothetical protein